jgi:hypothetical protein
MREEDDQLYVYELYGISTPRRFKANNNLRARIGPTTRITEEQIQKAQSIIDNPVIDFKPYAFLYVQKIEHVLEDLKLESYGREEKYNLITIPLTQLKGQGAMFGNPLVSEISSMILKLLEHYQTLDDDMLSVLNSYCKSIRAAYDLRLTTVSSQGGGDLVNEFAAVMQRYAEKFRGRTGR